MDVEIIAGARRSAAFEIAGGRFIVRPAANEDEVRAAQRLRFEVFNLELGEGLPSAFDSGLDRDEFDAQCDHLLLIDNTVGRVTGTYRLQTAEMAGTENGGMGFYSATEFDLSCLPGEILSNSVELGRACIAAEHRNTEALLLLWRGIAAYARIAGKRYLFGCCSIRCQSAGEAWSLTRTLAREGCLHPELFIPPLPGFECEPEYETEAGAMDLKPAAALQVARLLKSYLRLGARACGPPAIDRRFGTIDFFMLFDLDDLKGRVRKLLLES